MDRRIRRLRRCILAMAFGVASAMGMAPAQAQEFCGGVEYPFPYTDVSGIGAAFCPGIMEAYVTGVSRGTTPTTFSPNETVSRVQMTTFLQRSLDQGLARTSRRAGLNQWWTTQSTNVIQAVPVSNTPFSCAGDGEHIWASTQSGDDVIEVQASTGAVVGTWTGATSSTGILAAAGMVFAVGSTSPGGLYVLDPTQPPGVATLAASNLGNVPLGLAFDGTRLWAANSLGGSVSIITPQAATPYPVTNVTTGFTSPAGIIYDGTNIWVTDHAASKLFKLDGTGAIIQTVTVGTGPAIPAFDGINIWVPNQVDNSITVVQASSGNVVATISTDANNHLGFPTAASFDGERVLVTNSSSSSVTLFKAADLSLIANVATASAPFAACSDGLNFWVSAGLNLLRF
jgi:hypothetical protein